MHALAHLVHYLAIHDSGDLGFSFESGMEWIAGFTEGFTEENNLLDLEKCVLDFTKMEPEVEAIINDLI